MPSAAFFSRLGLFVRTGFLGRDECAQLVAEACAAPHEPSLVARHGVDEILDERIRNTMLALVSDETRQRVERQFGDLMPELEAHFATPLAGSETPGFLIYEPGSFFSAHVDRRADDPPYIRRRKVSAVVFLNTPSDEAAPGTYGGGTLTFHRLLDGPHWEGCSFAFERPEAGMLLAFRSDMLHEVLPVTFGLRLTIVTWFFGREA